MPWRCRWRSVEKVPAAARWAAVLLWMAVIFTLSAQPHLPQAPEPWLDTLLKKTAHGLEYAILALLVRWGLRGHGVAHAGRWAWVWAVLYALTDEAHQALVPGRHPSGWDVGIDGLGAALGLGVRSGISGIRNGRPRPAPMRLGLSPSLQAPRVRGEGDAENPS